MQIKIMETGEVISLTEFYERNPSVQLPQPPKDEDLAPLGAQLADQGPTSAPVPHEVPRWAGILALKRHKLAAGALTVMEPDDAGAGSLHAEVIAYRESLPSGEAADRLDAALNDAKDWLRTSPTVLQMSALLQLSEAQADTLFVWAGAQVGTV